MPPKPAGGRHGVHLVAKPTAPPPPEAKLGKTPPKPGDKTAAPPPPATQNVTSAEPSDPNGAPGFGKGAQGQGRGKGPPARAPRPPPPPENRPPEVVDHPTPVLPADLRAEEFRGQALILFLVDAEGNAKPHLLQSTGNAQVDALALDAARRWRFKPALQEGKPTPAQIQVELAISVE